jgi:predicted regulator of Ras-like GTPase activity (Roadblock/LC7/MglB family)
MTSQLAADPTSLIFLRLGEALRQRGQLDAALKVAQQGRSRYPHLPDAHDLYARILADRQDFATAFDEWEAALRLAPTHVGAHKGIGFLYHYAGERELALHHLRMASAADPSDTGLRVAIERVASGQATGEASEVGARGRGETGRATPGGEADPFAEVEGASDRVLLVTQDGLRLGGALRSPEGQDVSELAGAAMTAVTREAGRAARLLDLGEWTQLSLECARMSLALQHPSEDSCLLAAMDASLPAGQLTLYAERAAKAARQWLERVR